MRTAVAALAVVLGCTAALAQDLSTNFKVTTCGWCWVATYICPSHRLVCYGFRMYGLLSACCVRLKPSCRHRPSS